jgi:hypothetical protein
MWSFGANLDSFCSNRELPAILMGFNCYFIGFKIYLAFSINPILFLQLSEHKRTKLFYVLCLLGSSAEMYK